MKSILMDLECTAGVSSTRTTVQLPGLGQYKKIDHTLGIRLNDEINRNVLSNKIETLLKRIESTISMKRILLVFLVEMNLCETILNSSPPVSSKNLHDSNPEIVPGNNMVKRPAKVIGFWWEALI